MKITSKNLDHGAIALASGRTVEVIRQPAGRRALFIFESSAGLDALIDAYERREVLSLPPKEIVRARTELFHQAKRVSLEGI